MAFKISGLNAEPFSHLLGRSEHYLKLQKALTINVNSYPDRISLGDIPASETAILINHTYQPADTSCHGSHAIYGWEGCNEKGRYINKVPESIGARLLSLRALMENHIMLHADICEGAAAERL